MAYEVVFSPEAVTQIEELEAYLAGRFSGENAARYIQRLVASCLSLASAPHRGTRRDDLAPGIRTTGFERRVTIYFKLIETRVIVIGIFYAGRDFTPSQEK